jgi:hypothetical protein
VSACSSVVLWPTYSAALVLQGECGVVEVESPNETILVALTPLIQTGGSGVSGPDIYAFAAAYG